MLVFTNCVLFNPTLKCTQPKCSNLFQRVSTSPSVLQYKSTTESSKILGIHDILCTHLDVSLFCVNHNF